MFSTLADIRRADKSLLNKMRFVYLQSRIQSYRSLSAIHPFDKFDEATHRKNMELLAPWHSQYVRDISAPAMAASLELSAFLLSLCEASGYKKIVDLGSGFSSFVFRYYAKTTPGVEVYSVDDDAQWLEKTRGYLKSREVSDNNLMTLKEFIRLDPGSFDCILHDLNFVEVRIEYVKTLLAMLGANGIFILDDMHKPEYRYKVLKELRGTSWDIYNAKEFTHDKFGRYSMIALKP